MELREDEMSKVNGGAFKYGAWIIIGGIFTLIAGIIDGYLRPLTCNK